MIRELVLGACVATAAAVPAGGAMDAAVVNCCGGVDDEEESPADRADRIYRTLIRDFARLQAIFKQQPGNRNAIQREAALLTEHVAALRQGALPGAAPRPDAAGEAADEPVAPAEVGPPGGPVRPSSTPPSPEDIARFLAALERTHRPGPIDAGNDEVSLRDVRADWIAEICKVTEAELTQLSRLAEAEMLDGAAIEASLERLAILIDRMDEPVADEDGPPHE